MAGRSEPRHIFNNSKHRNVHFIATEHTYTLTSIGKSHFLRSSDHNGAGDCQRLHQSKMYVARTRRHIYHKVVKLAPIRLADKLLQRIARHTATPKHCTVLIHEETNRKELHAVFLDRSNQIASADFVHIHRLVLYTEHLRNRRSENVGIEQPYLIALRGKRDSEIARDSGFADTTLAGRHTDYVLHTGKRILRLLDHLTELHGNVALDFGILARISKHGSLGRLHYRLHKRVRRLIENQRERNLHTVDAYIVLHHIVVNQILSVSGIPHVAQCVEYQSRI